MTVDVNRTQDVFRDPGDNVVFLQLELNRKDQKKEKDVVEDIADRVQAIKRSMYVRDKHSDLKIAFGLSNDAWEYLFPDANKPKELETFKGIKGDKYDAPATKADLFFHVRANSQAVVYAVIDQLMTYLQPVTTTVDETHGFHNFEGRAAVEFIDGTENPVNDEAVKWGVIGDEDPEFVNGSYAFAQKFNHRMGAWKNLPTETQEKIIGRHKYSDLELDESEKDPRAHNIVAQDKRGGETHNIVRMNVPFWRPGKEGREGAGTYFIGYARYWDVTRQMEENMFTKNDRLLDYSTAVTGTLFFIPSLDTLDKIAADEY